MAWLILGRFGRCCIAEGTRVQYFNYENGFELVAFPACLPVFDPFRSRPNAPLSAIDPPARPTSPDCVAFGTANVKGKTIPLASRIPNGGPCVAAGDL
jgi:hypothetical protein